MFGQSGFIAVDWGTTNRRAYRVGADGLHDAEFEDERGVLSIASGGFPKAAAEICERLGDWPLLLAGMVGSTKGWVEAPYVPGLSYLAGDRADVMRGEEVQMLGAVASGLIPSDGLACHPGTHNKWVLLKGGRIIAFRTIMTGELFNLLKHKGILADWLQGPAEPGEAFGSGVRQGLKGTALTADLFAVRARVLLGEARAEDAASFVSGLLIGADVLMGLKDGAGDVTVIGRPELTRLYAAAIAQTGRTAHEVDGEKAFLAGIVEIARRMP